MSEPKKISKVMEKMDNIPQISEKSTTKLTKYSEGAPKPVPFRRERALKLKLPHPDGGTAMMTVDNSIPAHANEEFAKAFFTLLAHANKVDNVPKMEKWMWLECFERNDITPVEAVEGFYGACGEQYVGKDGIEFKHVMKHVRKFRSETYEVPEMGPTMEQYLEGKVSDSAD